VFAFPKFLGGYDQRAAFQAVRGRWRRTGN